MELNALYEGQPLFCDVDRFLRDNGFVLWRLSTLAHYATEVQSGEKAHITIAAEPGGHQHVHFDNGQLFWADAVYVREEATNLNDRMIDREMAIAGAALATQWNLNDLAIQMLRKSGDDRLVRDAINFAAQSEVSALNSQIEALQRRVVDLQR